MCDFETNVVRKKRQIPVPQMSCDLNEAISGQDYSWNIVSALDQSPQNGYGGYGSYYAISNDGPDLPGSTAT